MALAHIFKTEHEYRWVSGESQHYYRAEVANALKELACCQINVDAEWRFIPASTDAKSMEFTPNRWQLSGHGEECDTATYWKKRALTAEQKLGDTNGKEQHPA